MDLAVAIGSVTERSVHREHLGQGALDRTRINEKQEMSGASNVAKRVTLIGGNWHQERCIHVDSNVHWDRHDGERRRQEKSNGTAARKQSVVPINKRFQKVELARRSFAPSRTLGHIRTLWSNRMQGTVGLTIGDCRYWESVHVGNARAADSLRQSQPAARSNNLQVKLAQPSNRTRLQVEIV